MAKNMMIRTYSKPGFEEIPTSLYLKRADVPLVKAWMVTAACRSVRNICRTTTMRWVFWITKAAFV